MLELKIAGEPLDLLPGTTITIDEESPVFSDALPGGFSYPFDLPISARNSRILGFPDRIERNGAGAIELGCELYFDGRLLFTGTLQVAETSGSYHANLFVANGDLAGRIAGKKLKEVDLGGVRTWISKGEYTQEDDFALFPIYNPDFLVDLPGYNWASSDYRLNVYSGGLFYYDRVAPGANAWALSAFPFVSYLVKQILSDHGFFVLENVLATDPDLRRLVLYNTRDISSVDREDYIETVSLGTDEYGNEITEDVPATAVFRDMDTFNLQDCMPDVTITDFLKWLKNKFNLAILIDRFDQARIVRRDQLMIDPPAEDITSLASDQTSVYLDEIGDGFKIAAENDSNDTLFGEDNFKKIDDYIDLYRGSLANLTALAAIAEPGLNDIYFVESVRYYYQFQYVEDTGGGDPGYTWKKWSIAHQNYISGKGEEEFASGISTLPMIQWQRNVGGSYVRVPWAQQKSNGMERTSIQPFSPRVLLYHGKVEDSLGTLTPYGSSDNLDMQNNLITGANLTLHNEGTYGIYEQLWKNYLSWWMRRKRITTILSDPTRLQFDRKYMLDRKHLILKKRTLLLSDRGIEPSECEFYVI